MKFVPISKVRSIKAVIFDLDGVIVDSEGAQRRTFNKIFLNFGVQVSKAHWAKHYTAVGAFAVIEDVFRRNGIREDVGEWVAKRAEIYSRHIRERGLPAVPGFSGFYRLLKKKGIKMAIASGSQREIIAATIRSIGLPNLVYFGIDDVKRRKPAPDLFLLAARQLGVKPGECLVFEDAPAGFEAALVAGMPCIALTTTNSKSAISGKAALIAKDFRSQALKRLTLRLISRQR